MKKLLLAGVACAAFASQAHATLVTTADLFSPLPPSGSTTTVIGVQNGNGATPVSGTGYSVAFNVGADQGVVTGAIPSTTHATPVAGVTGTGGATYLTGDFGSAQTTNPNVGKYLSTGLGTITITFTTPQTSLALLWGSIDASNRITFNNSSNDVLLGSTVQSLAAGFTRNGFQGPSGSAYVTTTASSTFTTATLSSGVVSFEAAGIAGSTGRFNVPEPASIALLGAGLLGLGLARRKKA